MPIAEELSKKSKTFSYEGNGYSFFHRIIIIKDNRDKQIRIGILSIGRIVVELHRETERDLRNLKFVFLIPGEVIDFNHIYSVNYNKFVQIDFLVDLGESNLDLETKHLLLKEHDHLKHDNFPKILSKLFRIAIHRYFKSENHSNGKNPQRALLKMTLGDMFEEFYCRPDRRALHFRNEIATRYGFSYNPKENALEIKNDDGELKILLNRKREGEVFINDRHVCIEADEKDLPNDDIVASKMLCLAIPDLRDQISTIHAREKRILNHLFERKNKRNGNK